MDDAYAIRLAKTEVREAYRTGNVNRLLGVFADSFSDLSVGLPFSAGHRGIGCKR